MGRYIIKRVIMAVVTLFIITFLLFLLVRIMPGNPFPSERMSDEAIAKKINSAMFPGTQGGPLMHIIAAKAVALGEALRPEFRVYQHQIVSNAAAPRKASAWPRSTAT